MGTKHRDKKGGKRIGSKQIRKGKETCRRQDRCRTRLLAAGIIFVLLVAGKLLWPGSVSRLAEHLQREMGQDADFKAAFSAVGEAIAGEQAVSDSLQEVYTAVFAPAEYREERTAAVFAAGKEAAQPAMRLARELTEESGGGEGTDAEASTELSVDQALIYFSAAPANVSFAQAALGFPYVTPVRGTMTSAFGYREHPVYGEERFHYGLDIAAARGSKIGAFADGTVTVTGESSSLGKYLILAHEGEYTTLYAHCDKVLARSGDVVKAGEKIAEMGSSGMTTGTHLHFELMEGSTYLNPIYYVEIY